MKIVNLYEKYADQHDRVAVEALEAVGQRGQGLATDRSVANSAEEISLEKVLKKGFINSRKYLEHLKDSGNVYLRSCKNAKILGCLPN